MTPTGHSPNPRGDGNIVPLPGAAAPPAHPPPLGTVDDVRVAVRAEMEAAKLSNAQVAREIGTGVSSATLSKWLRGAYEGDVAAVAERLRVWLTTRREKAARAIGGAGLDRHVPLSVTEEIEAVLGHAQSAGDVVLIHGRSGAGKSEGIGSYCRNHAAAHRVMMTGAVATLAGLLKRVADAVGAGDRHGSALEAEQAVVARLRDRNALLVIDEAHHLSPRLLDELRCIRDLAGCGLALVGGDELWSALASSPRCDQIVGRIGIRLSVGRPSEPDVRALAQAVLGRDPGEAEVKLLLAAGGGAGGLHSLRRLLIRAWILSQGGKRSGITAADLKAAAEEGGAA